MKTAIFDSIRENGWNLSIPLIQGGMGVGVSLSSLAGAVAKEGGMGVISTAQIGYDAPDFIGHEMECNLNAIFKHVKRAKEISEGNGMVAVNVMVALQHYKEHVLAAVKAGADAIICGAGLPVDLPALVKGSAAKIAPIVSSAKAAALILKSWMKKYQVLPDFIVVEGPKAGGHLGFQEKDIKPMTEGAFAAEITGIIAEKEKYETAYGKKIPVFFAGGIWDKKDASEAKKLGFDGVQAATRFVATEECDASFAYKMAYVNASAEDVRIIKSPVGMPGRALNNQMLKQLQQEKQKISRCYHCIKHCNPAEIPYCITNVLVNAVKGNVDEGLIFCGTNVEKVKKIETVHEVVEDLMYI